MEKSIFRQNRVLYTLWFFAVVSALMTLIPLKDTLFSCDDSISNFVYGRITDSRFSFKTAFEFALMRGKVGILFPLLITLRDYLYRNGNYAIYWMMQYVPVYANVLLCAWYISKKLSRELAPLFVILFSALLQVNGWHSLITCYPIEFMYGLFMELIGIILFDKYISGKKNALLMVVSVICFYEAMQTYEAFLLFGVFYAFLSYYSKSTWKERIRVLIPHMVTGLVYVGIFVFLNIHPVVASNGYNVTERGSITGFLLTDLIFAFGMFPLTNMFFPSVFSSLGKSGVNLVTVIASASAACGVFVFLSNYKFQKERQSKFLHAGIIGFVMALIFPMMHSMTSKYQTWAIKEHQFGYVPSTISYFGWVMVVISVVILIFEKLVFKKESLKKPLIIVLTTLTFIATFMTCLINSSIKVNGIGPASPKLSYKAQSMYTLATSKSFADLNCDLLFVPDYNGVHGIFIENEFIIQYETGNGVIIDVVNDRESFDEGFEEALSPCIYRYFYDEDIGVLIVPSDVNNGQELYVVSSHGFDGTISVDGVLRDIKLGRDEVLKIEGVNNFNYETLEVSSK